MSKLVTTGARSQFKTRPNQQQDLTFKVSVIIPVYNAEKYVRTAVESALQQEETGEVILVEDNSPDNCLQICGHLENAFQKVRLIRHFDGKNHGAGASRNIGIKNAQFDFIAFLDADDYYRSDRFKVAKELFEKYDDLDGVYEAVGVDFLNDLGKQRWLSRCGIDLITMPEAINSRDLFEALIKGRNGTIHLDGLIIKKKIFEHCGYFFEHLKLHQDTALILQMSIYGKLIPGRLDVPVAMRTIHNHNRILNRHDQRYDKYLYWKTLFNWAWEKGLPNRRLIVLFHRYIFAMFSLAKNNSLLFPRNFQGLKPLFFVPLKHPFLFIAAASQFVFKQFSR
jgi:glycosyltransferase involved in cell wall biosynthesis